MRLCLIGAIVMVITSNLAAAIKTQVIEYKHGDTVLEGFLAWDDSTTARRPAVVVVHEWWGNNDYPRKRAEQLAALGYVGFAIDMYGKGKTTKDPQQAAAWAGEIRNNPDVAKQRVQVALDTLKAQSTVDPEKLTAIGYCFGGGVVLHMARWNMPVLGVVSFHGSLGTPSPATGPIKPIILVCHGADDTFISPQEFQGFIDEMKKAKADWQLDMYSGALHAFTNPDADKAGIPGVAYNKKADERSWEAMKDFLAEVYGK